MYDQILHGGTCTPGKSVYYADVTTKTLGGWRHIRCVHAYAGTSIAPAAKTSNGKGRGGWGHGNVTPKTHNCYSCCELPPRVAAGDCA